MAIHVVLEKPEEQELLLQCGLRIAGDHQDPAAADGHELDGDVGVGAGDGTRG